jgi:hypothetical protein
MGCSVVCCYGLIGGLSELLERAVYDKTQLLLYPSIEPLDFPSSLRMIGRTKDVLYPMGIPRYPAKSLEVKPDPLSE